jgi:hypothetical protein
MLNKNISIIIASVLITLLGCLNSPEPTEVDPDLKVSRSALIGVWEAETPVNDLANDFLGLTYHNLDIYALEFTEDEVHFLRWKDNINKRFPQPDSIYRFFVGTAASWSVSGNLLTFSENPYLYFDWNLDWVLPVYDNFLPPVNNLDSVYSQIGDLRYASYKAESLDTLRLWSAKLTPESTPIADDAGDTIAYSRDWLVLGAPFEFRIISKGKESDESDRKSEAIRLVDRECYDRLINMAGIDSLCNVKVFFKRNRPAFSEIVANAKPIRFQISSGSVFQGKPEYFDSVLEIQPDEVPFSYLYWEYFRQPEPIEE